MGGGGAIKVCSSCNAFLVLQQGILSFGRRMPLSKTKKYEVARKIHHNEFDYVHTA